jgi:N-acetylglucosamine-6-sulfatase
VWNGRSIIQRVTPSSGRRADRTGTIVRRGAIAVLAVLAIGSTFVWALGRDDGDAARPNIVLVVADDQRWDTLDAMPAIGRRLVEGGVTFRNAFATTPSCCPSRVSFLTGRYSHTTGVLDGSTANAPGGAPAFDDRSSLATWLDDAGYRTGMVGKYLNDYGELPEGYVPPGWDEWFALADRAPQIRYYDYRLNENGSLVAYGDEPDDYSTRVLERKAVEFVRGDGPFFLYLAPIAPHPPSIPDPVDAAAGVPPWTPPPSFDEADVSDKPGRAVPPVDRAEVETIRQDMLRSLAGVDRAVDAVAAAIDAAGRSEETYFIYTSDNGFLWGEHRRTGKVWPYEESIRVPLVIRAPGSTATRTEDGLALNIDVAPTIADLAGVEAGLAMEGTSLVPVLAGEEGVARDRFVIEFLGFAPGVPPYVGLRLERWVYVEYRGGDRELYDLRTDPYQLDNLLAGATTARVEGLARTFRRELRELAPAVDLEATTV